MRKDVTMTKTTPAQLYELSRDRWSEANKQLDEAIRQLAIAIKHLDKASKIRKVDTSPPAMIQ